MKPLLQLRLSEVIIVLMFVLFSCTGERGSTGVETAFCLYPRLDTKASADPDPVLISDFNLLIYNCFGLLEEAVYVSERDISEVAEYSTTLLGGSTYTVLVGANFGYPLGRMSLSDAMAMEYYMAYPDEYSHGIPMAAVVKGVLAGDRVNVRLERLMAAVDISLDRSGLDPGVEISPVEVSVGNCPSAVKPFDPGKAVHFFHTGFSRSGRELDALENGGALRMYVLENLAGDSPSSYIEIKSAYHSSSSHSKPGEYLIYRFYLKGESSYDIRRNTLYRVTVCPVGDGLSCDDGWRVDAGAVD